MLNTEFFTHDKDVLRAIAKLQRWKEERPEDFCFSDIIDNDGLQYIDLVQEGGGVLGVALLGYVYALECAGLRFLSLAGTSAGAINTVLLAAAGKPNEAKALKLIEQLANQDFYEFVDGDHDAKKFIEAIVEDKSRATQIFRGIQIWDNLTNDIGLNPGDAFVKWVTDVLEKFNVRTTQDLLDKLHDLPTEVSAQLEELARRYGEPAVKQKKTYPLAVVTADISTETKVVFPEMGELYFEDPMSVNPAFYVRASMSVPLFFHPLVRRDIPDSPERILAWTDEVNYTGKHPDEITFVDGGIMSNFPINIFHRKDREPSRPTFGVKLGLDRDNLNEIDSVMGLLGACFNAARQMADNDFIMDNPDYREVVAHIETGDHNWLNFGLTDEAKLDLFRRGVVEAVEFLERFDWEEYKEIRRGNLLKVVGNLLDTEPGTLEDALDRAASVQNLPLEDKDKRNLISRLKLTRLSDSGYRVLWIDDNKDRDSVEFSLLESIKIRPKVVTSSAEAETELKNGSVKYDIVISDVDRAGSPTEGIDFLKKLHQESTDVPPTIFYLQKLDPSKGVPPYAFGITNSPVELLHLVLDVLQRG